MADEPEEQPAAVSDPPSFPEPDVWKFAKFVMRLLGKLTFAIGTSVGAALILLVGGNSVLSFGILGLLFVIALLTTAVKLVLLFLACTIVSFLALAAIVRASAYVSSRRIAVVKRWGLHVVQRRVRKAVLRMRAFSRTQPRTEQVAAFYGIVLIMAVVLMIAYLMIRGAESWNATWRGVRLLTRAPVERVGRSETSPQVSKLADVAKYVNARRDKVAAKVNAMTQLALARGDHPVVSRCGRALPLRPAEARPIAELYVDLTEAPPIVKREYILTEEQLTAMLSLVLSARSRDFSLDCVKLHRNYIQFFTTSVNTDGAMQNQALGVSLVKDTGSLRIVLDELSFGRASFQVGWLGLGVTGGRGGFVSNAEGAEWLADSLRAFDSRVFSVNVFEGYTRIVTWRLPSVVAARAAIDVGYTQQAVDCRVEPGDDAASSGVIRAGDLVYVLERTDEWLYVCSEVSGRFGWLPKAAFASLENWPGLSTQRHVKDSSHITAQQFLGATPNAPDAISARSFSFVALAWQCRVSAEGTGECHDGKSMWRFRLPVEDGRIDSLYVSPGDPFVFAYSLADEESRWGKLAGIAPRARRPAWTTPVGGLNLAVPVASTESVLITALAFVASVNRRTGSFQWRHDYVYDGSGRTTIHLATENNLVRVTATKSWGAEDAATVCYDFATGVVVACPAASLP
jgi:hypothetical protein